MKKAHVIIDYMPIFYKYKFRLDQGKIKQLTHVDERNGLNFMRDISTIYYSIKEIEGIRRGMVKQINGTDDDVVISICSDRKSKREKLDGGNEYKADRDSLHGEEFDNIATALELLKIAGYNVYEQDGYEADDLITALCTKFKDEYRFTVVYTNDKDLMVNVCDNVAVFRYKASTGNWDRVLKSNFESYLSADFNADIRYNSILLFLSTVGDRADGIKGIFRFGAKAYDKMVEYLDSKNVNWEYLADTNNFELIFPLIKEYLADDEKYEQFVQSYGLAKPLEITDFEFKKPEEMTTQLKRIEAYSRYEFLTLYD